LPLDSSGGYRAATIGGVVDTFVFLCFVGLKESELGICGVPKREQGLRIGLARRLPPSTAATRPPIEEDIQTQNPWMSFRMPSCGGADPVQSAVRDTEEEEGLTLTTTTPSMLIHQQAKSIQITTLTSSPIGMAVRTVLSPASKRKHTEFGICHGKQYTEPSLSMLSSQEAPQKLPLLNVTIPKRAHAITNHAAAE